MACEVCGAGSLYYTAGTLTEQLHKNSLKDPAGVAARLMTLDGLSSYAGGCRYDAGVTSTHFLRLQQSFPFSCCSLCILRCSASCLPGLPRRQPVVVVMTMRTIVRT